VGAIPEATSGSARAYTLSVKDLAGQPAPIGDNDGQTNSSLGGSQPGAGTTNNHSANSLPGSDLPWKVTPLPPPTPLPTATPTSPPTATPTPTAVIYVRRIETSAAMATPEPQQMIQINVTVYYDENNNQALDPSEGVAGISLRVLDEQTNQSLGHIFSDNNGHARLIVSAQDAVRVSAPYLGYNQRVRPPGDSVTIRLAPLRLPSLIP
jgi:hypothetical protein